MAPSRTIPVARRKGKSCRHRPKWEGNLGKDFVESFFDVADFFRSVVFWHFGTRARYRSRLLRRLKRVAFVFEGHETARIGAHWIGERGDRDDTQKRENVFGTDMTEI